MAALEHTLYYSQKLRDLWPDILAARWHSEYPGLFDDDDLRLTRNVSIYHFKEWFTAVHLFHHCGALSLVEKYGCDKKHPRKAEIRDRLMSKRQQEDLWRICNDECRVQAPDLLVYLPDFSKFWFAEAKGPNEPLSEGQRQSHSLLRRRFRVPVQVYRVTVR
jgi:hypothetical protein